jgi:ABC-type transport system involved in multi-copper enzyme maturation permease subunit
MKKEVIKLNLIRFEIEKLFFNKKTLILTLIFILMPFLVNILGELSFRRTFGSPEEAKKIYEPYEGQVDKTMGMIAKEKAEELLKTRSMKASSEKIVSKMEEQFYFDYSNAADNLEYYKSGGRFESPESPYSLKSLEKALEDLEKQGQENSYKYKSFQKQYSMMLSSGEPQFHYTRTWRYLFSFLSGGSFLFTSILILLVTAPIFSNEYSSGMDSIILSSKGGRKKIVTAKFIATVIYSILTVTLYNIIQFIGYILPSGTLGWEAPLKSETLFALTPYNLNMFQYFCINLLLQILGTVILSLIAVMISSLCKSSRIAFFSALCFLLYPYILGDVLGIKLKWIIPLIELSVAQVIRVINLFDRYRVYNFFNSPVLYPYFVVAIIFVMGTVSIIITHFNLARRDAC